MIEIDGSIGEGGGQILRSALSLAAITGEPLTVRRIRAARRRPGLMRQHLTALLAAAEVCGAEVSGAELGSEQIRFVPGRIMAGEYRFSVGTAGSTGLVLQTVAPILLSADAPSRLIISGGTHNPAAPPFEFLAEAWAPALRLIGHGVDLRLHRHGFYPAGGGEIEVELTPGEDLVPLVLEARGAAQQRSLEVLISHLSSGIARRELAAAAKPLDVAEANRHIRTPESTGPGNVLIARLQFAQLTALFATFGQPRVSAERVAGQLAKQARAYLRSDAAVTQHLADQLLVPMALARGGVLRTVRPSLHATTNAQIIERFLARRIGFEGHEDELTYTCVVR